MIIHAYLTDGFFPWAKLYLESFKFYNDNNYKVVLTTVGLDDSQVDELKNIYSNLIVENKNIDLDEVSKQLGITKDKLLKFKNQVETYHVNNKNKSWKMMFAAKDRLESIIDISKRYKNEKYILHTDIDLYFRSDISELIENVRKNDVSIRLRLNSKLNRKTMIGIQGYNISNNDVINFLNRWHHHLTKISPNKWPLGYGQTSCYYAYLDYKDKLNWYSVPKRFISPQQDDSDIIWSANTNEGKTENLKIFYKDFMTKL